MYCARQCVTHLSRGSEDSMPAVHKSSPSPPAHLSCCPGERAEMIAVTLICQGPCPCCHLSTCILQQTHRCLAHSPTASHSKATVFSLRILGRTVQCIAHCIYLLKFGGVSDRLEQAPCSSTGLSPAGPRP